jgi:pilus assembly protein CpaC
VVSPKAAQITVSMFLRDVTVGQALDALTKSFGLWYRPDPRTGTVYIYTNEERPGTPPDLGALEAEINETFPDSVVRLSMVGDKIVVRGEAKDVIEAEHIIRIVAESALPSRHPIVAPNINVNLNETSYLPDGSSLEVRTGNKLDRLLRASTGIVPGETNIINLLRVPGVQQVMLRVTVAEINRSAAREIGLNFSFKQNDGDLVFGNMTGAIAPALGAPGLTPTDPMTGIPGLGGLTNLPTLLDNGQVQLAIRALRQMQMARTLAEPNLTAMNGERATFHAGGKFPVPVVTGVTGGGPMQGVRYVPFGVNLEFTPYIVDRDRVRLSVTAEVSATNEESGTNIGGDEAAGGTSVPGTDNRNFSTTVELRDGQTLAVAGLLQTRLNGRSDRVPFWGDLPFIGHTGGYNRTSAIELELVILVTPELVHPIEQCERPPLPGADVFEPTDVEFFLCNRMESRRSRDYRSTVRTDSRRQIGYECHCVDKFLIGPAGYTDECLNVPVSSSGQNIGASSESSLSGLLTLPTPQE